MRLTEKNEFGYILHIKPDDNSMENEIAIVGNTADKLGQLEDIEEELGIDLITLFKALKNGIYGKVCNEIKSVLAPHLSWHYREIYIWKIKDYGKTWALTREELENDN